MDSAAVCFHFNATSAEWIAQNWSRPVFINDSCHILTSLGDVTTSTDLIASNRYGVAKGHDAWWTTEVHQKVLGRTGRDSRNVWKLEDRWIRWGIIMIFFQWFSELDIKNNNLLQIIPNPSSLICFDLYSSFWLDCEEKQFYLANMTTEKPGLSNNRKWFTVWQLLLDFTSSTSDLDFLIFLNSTTIERIRKMPLLAAGFTAVKYAINEFLRIWPRNAQIYWDLLHDFEDKHVICENSKSTLDCLILFQISSQQINSVIFWSIVCSTMKHGSFRGLVSFSKVTSW